MDNRLESLIDQIVTALVEDHVPSRADNRAKSICSSFHTLGYSDTTFTSCVYGKIPRHAVEEPLRPLRRIKALVHASIQGSRRLHKAMEPQPFAEGSGAYRRSSPIPDVPQRATSVSTESEAAGRLGRTLMSPRPLFLRLAQGSVRVAFVAICLASAICHAQSHDQPIFGTTAVIPGGLKGRIYLLNPNTWVLPNFEDREPVGILYTKTLYIPRRDFREGFPGITDRMEWFAIDFTGRFYIDTPAEHLIRLESDDGSKLYIDQKLVIDNDGDHPSLARTASVLLSGGLHSIRLSYFQGPGYELALMLSVSGPGNRKLRPFNTDDFKPPSNPDDWKYGTPEEFNESPDAHLSRRPAKAAIAVHAGEVVSIPIEILSNGRPVGDLKPGDFLIYDNGQPKEIASFSHADRVLDILLLVEASPGMRPFQRRLSDIALQTISKLDYRDHVGVIGFGSQPFLTIGMCARADRVAAAIRNSQPGIGAPDCNRAIAAGAEYLRDYTRAEASAAIVILTLNEGRGDVSDAETRNALWRANITLNGLIPEIGFTLTMAGPEAADIRPLIEATGRRFAGDESEKRSAR